MAPRSSDSSSRAASSRRRRSWRNGELAAATMPDASLWIDFGFMLSYGAFFTLAAIATRDFARENDLRRLAAVGIVAPFAAASAAIFDEVRTSSSFLLSAGMEAALALRSLRSAQASSSY